MNFRLICLVTFIFVITDSAAQINEYLLVNRFSIQVIEKDSAGQLRVVTLQETIVGQTKLKVNTDRELVVFNDDKALTKLIPGEYYFDYDSLYNSLDYSKSLGFWVAESPRLSHLEVGQYQLIHLSSPSVNTSVLPKPHSPTSDLSIIALTLILGLMGHYFHKHRDHAFSSLDLFQALSVRTNDEPIFRFRIFTVVTIKSMALISLMTSYLLFHLLENQIIIEGFKWTSKYLTGQVLGWLLLAVVVYVILLLKYQLIIFNAKLFSMKNVVVIQFYNGLRLLFLSVFSLAILKFGLGLYYGASVSYEIIVNSLVLALIVRLMVASYKLLSIPNFRIVPLIVYLCATEIVPFALAFFVLMK